MKFETEIIAELACESAGEEIEWDGKQYAIMENDMIDTGRWDIQYRLVFQYQGDKYYEVYYSRGATEYQDYDSFEDEGDEMECQEVEPVEVKVIKYKRVDK